MAKEFYDDLSSSYHLIYSDWPAVVEKEGETIDRIIKAELSGPTSEIEILDCAAGIGTQAIGLARKGYRVAASDLSPKSLERLKSNSQRLNGGLAGPIETVVSSFDELNIRFASSRFSVCICLDNAIAHLPTKADLTASFSSMRDVIRDNGLLILSVRPYDELLTERPIFHPKLPKFSDGRLYFQVWRWNEDRTYDSTFFLIMPDGEVKHWSSKFYPHRLSEIQEALYAAGLTSEVRGSAESGYFQPIIIARKRRGS